MRAAQRTDGEFRAMLPRPVRFDRGYWRGISAVLVWGVLLLMLRPSAAAARPVEWNRTSISARYSSAMVYEASRGVMFVYGGYAGSHLNEAWEWNGNGGSGGHWALQPVSGTTMPAGRRWHAMAYDTVRQVAVLFGGETSDGLSGETWEWSAAGGDGGGAWTLRSTSGPSPRDSHAMAYDSDRRVVMLFGGYTSSGGDGELWEWDGAAGQSGGGVWTRRALNGQNAPSPRWGHRMVYDSGRHLMLLFGGLTASGYSGETWEWNANGGGGLGAWTLRTSGGPSPRYAPAMGYDAPRGQTVLFGGYTANGYNGETWEWSGSAWVLRSDVGPTSRSSHVMAYDGGRRKMVMFGGIVAGGGLSNEIWEWNGAEWTRRADGGPVARQRHGMVYDSARGVHVLFGGLTIGTGYSGETWEWNGSESQGAAGNGGWVLRMVSGPSSRFQHAMCFDSGRGVTVLFGGTNGTGDNNQTWEWNGIDWTLRTAEGPSPSARANAAMAYDSVRGVTVLFGGSVGANYNGETWEWNGTTWTQRMIGVGPAPSPRGLHTMAYDPVRGVTVLFGGNAADGPNAETWEWNGSSWLQKEIGGPTARWGPKMAYDAANGLMVLFGGFLYDSGETWVYDGAEWAQRLPAGGPVPRDSHAMSYDQARGTVVLFGGITAGGASNGETWEWSGNTLAGGSWTQRVISGPSARSGHATAYDTVRGVSTLFGGFTGVPNNETWEWNSAAGGGSGAWFKRAVAGPSARFHHAMAYDSYRGVTVLFGGFTEVCDGQTWEWNGLDWSQRSTSGPSARWGHRMAYDTVRHVTVLFGGNDCSGDSDETWEWDGIDWMQRVASGPPARSLQAMAFDASRGVTVMFGGQTGGSIDDQTWEWNGATWSHRVLPGPSPRRAHTMTYDTNRNVIVLFGGDTGISPFVNNETWEYRGEGNGAWTRLMLNASDSPPARFGGAMVYDTGKGVSFLFGGRLAGGVYDGETWQLGSACAPPSITVEPVSQTLCIGGQISLSIAATGSGQSTYRWRKSGVNIADDASHISGSATPTLVVANVGVVDAGSYECVVSNACGTATSSAAMLVICPADFNCDEAVNSGDFFNFLAAFFTDAPAADFTRDGVINSQDFFDFLAIFFAGC